MTVKKKTTETLICILLICAMLLSFFPLLNYSPTSGYNRNNICGLYAEEEDSLDMIYIGGSACFVYWEALKAWEEYGFTSYSFAADTCTPQSIKFCIQEARKTQSPKLWVIDLRPFQYGDIPFNHMTDTLHMYYEPAIRNVTDNLQFSSLKFQLINISVPNVWERLDYYFPFLESHYRFATDYIFRFKSLLKGNTRDNPLKGFHFAPKTEPIHFTDYSSVTAAKPLEGTLNALFLDLLDYCKQEAITPLFVVHSYAQQKEHKQRYNYMKQVIESYGFDYLNANDHYKEIGLDFSFDFYNANHVNIFGADKYTAFLAAYIDKKYDMPDRRNEPRYAHWHALAENFQEMAAKTKEEIYIYQKENGR